MQGSLISYNINVGGPRTMCHRTIPSKNEHPAIHTNEYTIGSVYPVLHIDHLVCELSLNLVILNYNHDKRSYRPIKDKLP